MRMIPIPAPALVLLVLVTTLGCAPDSPLRVLNL